MPTTSLVHLSLVDARDALRDGRFSCIDYVNDLLTQTARHRDLNAFVAQDVEQLFADAQSFDRSQAAGEPLGALAGIPIALSDNIDTATMPTGGGTPALQGKIPPHDAAIVDRLLVAEALIAGKTNVHELGFGATTNNPLHGAARNPYDPHRSPGGSSGGSAVAVAARMVPGAIGTDQAVSIRIPAAMCGIVGFRPSLGRYPMTGIMPMACTRDTVGLLARSVADIGLLDEVLAKKESSRSFFEPRGLRLGTPAVLWQDLDANVSEVTRSALGRLSRCGVSIIKTDIMDLRELNRDIGGALNAYEFLRDFPAYLRRSKYELTLRKVASQISSPDVARVVARLLSAPHEWAALYRAACIARGQLQRSYQRCFEGARVDALIFPTSPMTAWLIEENNASVRHRAPTFETLVQNTDPAGNAGLPGISLPAGSAPNGLPVGLALDGRFGSDLQLLAIAASVEKILGPIPQPPLLPA